jgi:hypothetical protein
MKSRPRIAALVSIYHRYAHAQHIVDRFLEGYGWNGKHHRPEMDVVSLYVDQINPAPAEPEEGKQYDLSQDRVDRFPKLNRYPTIADALTCGTETLAVDGVLIIAEHGEYNVNEKGQTLWPRYEFFKQMLSVFRVSGKSVPVFNDKHLSWNWDWAKEMYDASIELDFPFMAGSSLPVTWRTPSIELPLESKVNEAMCVGCGWSDGGDLHGFETIQGMVERRDGGETGIRWIEAFRGERFWKALSEEQWSRSLFDACLSRGHELTPARAGFNHTFPTIDEMKHLVSDPWAYQYQHTDGLICTMIAMNGLFGGSWAFSADIEGKDDPISTYMYLPMPPGHTTLANFFSPQVNNIEKMFLTGEASYPIERTLLTTGLTIAGVESIHNNQSRIQTPHLSISYQPNPKSTYWHT